MHSHIEAMKTYRLILKSNFQLDPINNFYVSSFSRNLIFVCSLTCIAFELNFYGSIVDLLKDEKIVGSRIYMIIYLNLC